MKHSSQEFHKPKRRVCLYIQHRVYLFYVVCVESITSKHSSSSLLSDVWCFGGSCCSSWCWNGQLHICTLEARQPSPSCDRPLWRSVALSWKFPGTYTQEHTQKHTHTRTAAGWCVGQRYDWCFSYFNLLLIKVVCQVVYVWNAVSQDLHGCASNINLVRSFQEDFSVISLWTKRGQT